MCLQAITVILALAAVRPPDGYTNGNPAWSPDGRRVAFVSDRNGNREIYVMNVDGSEAVNLSRTAAGEMHPSWSPDGSEIYFDSDRSGDPELYVMNADGSDVRRLTESPGFDLVPLSSPDGQWVAFNSQRSGNWDVWRMRLSDGALENLTAHPATDIARSWSRDGTRVLFDSDRNTDDGRRQGYTRTPDGSAVVRLTTSDADERFFRSGPPGTDWVVFTSTRGGTRGLWRVALEGGEPTVFFDSLGADSFATWSPDGNAVIFESDMGGRADLYWMRRDGTGLRRLTDGSAPR